MNPVSADRQECPSHQQCNCSTPFATPNSPFSTVFGRATLLRSRYAQTSRTPRGRLGGSLALPKTLLPLVGQTFLSVTRLLRLPAGAETSPSHNRQTGDAPPGRLYQHTDIICFHRGGACSALIAFATIKWHDQVRSGCARNGIHGGIEGGRPT